MRTCKLLATTVCKRVSPSARGPGRDQRVWTMYQKFIRLAFTYTYPKAGKVKQILQISTTNAWLMTSLIAIIGNPLPVE